MLFEEYIISHGYGIVHPLTGGFGRIYSHICFRVFEVRVEIDLIIGIRSDKEYYFVSVFYGDFPFAFDSVPPLAMA